MTIAESTTVNKILIGVYTTPNLTTDGVVVDELPETCLEISESQSTSLSGLDLKRMQKRNRIYPINSCCD